jgi:hypothetical protein
LAVTGYVVPEAVKGSSVVLHVVAGNAIEHKSVAPASTSIVPVGVPEVCGVTPAVKVTPDSWPYVTGDGGEMEESVVVVGCWSIVTETGDEVRGPSTVLPGQLATTEYAEADGLSCVSLLGLH